ncbi:hypothetical protein B0H17DRAFT_1255986 [Mycena rosella]|uniref:Uncharacterized protein n=1 Tax=Mycena rosella TaxID=1033263 RepID=A0AAD7CVD7_MYCRO|nr:hypothetical protein B0H17DRAFT_1255986 [Mycena rosella]
MHSLSLITLVLIAASAILAHAPVKATRSEHLLTNAQRLKRGLPPLPPVARWSPTRHALAPRASPVLCTTTQTISGLIEVTDSSTGVFYGYVTTDYFMGYSTVDPTENLRTVSITISCNPNADDLVGLNVASGTDDHPYFGAIMSYYATDNDMSSATDNYAWMGTTDLTTAVPTVVGNSPQDAQGAEQASESRVWTYDPATAALTLTWYNTDGSAGTTIPVKVGSILYATGNVEQLAGRFNRPDVRIIKYRLVQTTVVQNR